MGTNYYRIPRESEVQLRKKMLLKRIQDMNVTPENIESNFSFIKVPGGNEWDTMNPWDEFMNNIAIHIGKRSSGWIFLWNFNDNKHYTTKEELFEFIRQGRIVNEYGEELEADSFIEMALDWFQTDGKQFEGNEYHSPDRNIGGLRVSPSTDFS